MGTNCCVCGKKPCETRAVCTALWLEQVRKEQAYQEVVARAKAINSKNFRAAFEALAKQPPPPPTGWDWTSVTAWHLSNLPWGAKPRKKKRNHSKADRAAVEAFVASLKPSGGTSE